MSYWSTTPPRRAHILVIDDNVEELQLLLGVLREAGHRISLAFNALEGYRRATALQPDLILLDVRMGATDGFATCRLLKADRATTRIPVIFVTSSSSVQERLTGLREGAVDYILKPFEPAEVLARVAVHLALSSSRQQAQACIAQAESAVENAKRERGASTTPGADHTDRVLAQAVERLVRADLANVPTLPELAARVGTHEKRLSRVFREQTGRTVLRVRTRGAPRRGAAAARGVGAQRGRSRAGRGLLQRGQLLDRVPRALRPHAYGVSPGACRLDLSAIGAVGLMRR